MAGSKRSEAHVHGAVALVADRLILFVLGDACDLDAVLLAVERATSAMAGVAGVFPMLTDDHIENLFDL